MALSITVLLQKIHPSTRKHLPHISLSPRDQFRRVVASLIQAIMSDGTLTHSSTRAPVGLRKVPAYWYPYTTMAKMRWLGRELLEVVSTEFRDRSMEYYRYALESGVTTVNGKIAKPDTVIRDGDRIENIVHRHEPPVTSSPVKILHHDVEREFIVVDKPGSIPVHASGRYFKNTLIEILMNEFGYEKVYPVNRLDRLTSGLMIVPLSADCARRLTAEFQAGTVRKEYIARCKGEFPVFPPHQSEVVCEEPLLTVDRQMGLNVVHPAGKSAKTVFNRLHYDPKTDSSVVRCRPLTGRSHQIRVHLQFLGYPIANDPVYSDVKTWGETLGKGGIDITPSSDRSAPAPPPHLQPLTEAEGSPETLSKLPVPDVESSYENRTRRLLPRETGEDIGMGSPVPLSNEAVRIITNLRNKKDEDEDWSRWRDVVFRAKGALSPQGLKIKAPPPQNRRKRGGRGEFIPSVAETPNDIAHTHETPQATSYGSEVSMPQCVDEKISSSIGIVETGKTTCLIVPDPGSQELSDDTKKSTQLTTDEALRELSAEHAVGSHLIEESGNLYCSECYLPLHPDPKPEKLYIFLHALKYTTSLGEFEAEMPEWAAVGWEWDQS
ncbi:hypothetical protein AMATHDRAFT_39694 [Amanita thiersii Skay4041]|uniref:Pseudouridine synthase RsuA/RluA-like domain-containing protein n=1 Tax=Amanita thiersii Skay4041 TaxID=703135 RepID=A0A2A9NNS4_9AGAR|nr:hypothetical protein AMATHDRAFT_39694 [Amanita thiersii Skay4041]